MAFQEKSAWVMVIALLLGGLSYYGAVSNMTSELGQLAPPVIPSIIKYTVILIIVAIVGNIAIAVMTPKEADAPLDERDKSIMFRASHWSGYVLGVGLLWSLGFYLLSHNGDLLFYGVFASLMISQLAEYGVQIFLYRFA